MLIQVATNTAERVSAAIYKLTRPDAVRDPRDVSTHVCSWIVHPTDTTKSLLVINDDIPIHKLVNSDAFATLLRARAVPEAEALAVKAVVDGKKEARVLVSALVPDVWKARVVTVDQAKTLGYFPDALTT